jgi:hypothetical protein
MLTLLTAPAIALAGCIATDEAVSQKAALPPRPVVAPRIAIEPSRPPQKPETKPAEKPATLAAKKPALPAIEPKSVVGVTESEAEELFGPPKAVAERPPAVVWEYIGSDCALSLHFYMDMSTRKYRVLTYKIAPDGIAEEACLENVRNGKG